MEAAHHRNYVTQFRMYCMTDLNVWNKIKILMMGTYTQETKVKYRETCYRVENKTTTKSKRRKMNRLYKYPPLNKVTNLERYYG